MHIVHLYVCGLKATGKCIDRWVPMIGFIKRNAPSRITKNLD